MNDQIPAMLWQLGSDTARAQAEAIRRESGVIDVPAGWDGTSLLAPATFFGTKSKFHGMNRTDDDGVYPGDES